MRSTALADNIPVLHEDEHSQYSLIGPRDQLSLSPLAFNAETAPQSPHFVRLMIFWRLDTDEQ